MKEVITIQISKFLNNKLAEEIARARWNAITPQWVNRSRQSVFDQLVSGNDCFEVIATTANQGVIGRIHCIKNETDPTLWYYGDLFVIPAYRRMGIATQMIRAAIHHLSEIGAATLRCYVDPANLPSRNLQTAVGFAEKPYQTFNKLTNDGEIMYEIGIPGCLTVIPATMHEAYFVRLLFAQNKSAFPAENIRLCEWKALLSAEEQDKKHFLVCKGAVPLAYMQLHAQMIAKEMWISMLFVAKDFQHQGVGSFAIRFAERYATEAGFCYVKTSVDKDNAIAHDFFAKCGYTMIGQNAETTFFKAL